YFRRDFIKNLEIKHTGALHQYCSGPTTTNTCLSLAGHPFQKHYSRSKKIKFYSTKEKKLQNYVI
ncbi:hypothetical protein, partial [Acinetobacter sp. UNC436CL71CviS28]|uniref:hypothetical protein n=1 Tax=Acinetobacter sp. UNC436CL71CviS28 TaxID=1380368 RepID=UPI001BB2D432